MPKILGAQIGGRREPPNHDKLERGATPRLYATGFALVGVLLIVATFYLDEHYHPNPKALLGWGLLKLIDETGIALILLGLVVIVLEFRDWKEYFQDQIANTIVKKEYLRTLGNEALISLQTDTLKAFFKIDDIDRKDGFLQFFHSRIHGYIGSPYREDARDLVSIKHLPGNPDRVEIEEALSYRCRKVGGRIQDDVKWEDSAETEIKLLDYSVELREPASASNQFREKREVFNNNTASSHRFVPRGDQGFRLLLRDYDGVDGLYVKVHVHYTMPVSWPMVWTMSHPTKGATANINHPDDLRLLPNFFGMKESEVSQEHQPGVYQAGYDSWLLPDTGFCFQLIKPEMATQAAKNLPAPVAAKAAPVQHEPAETNPGREPAKLEVLPGATQTEPKASGPQVPAPTTS